MLEHEIEPEIDKYDTHKNSVPKMGHLAKKCRKVIFHGLS